jgi:hypothetical protein
VISGLEDAYEKITESVTDFENKLLNTLNGFSRHPLIQVGSITEALKNTFSEIKDDLSNTRKNHPELTRDDRVRDEVTKIFEGRVGPAYPDEQLRKIYAEGKVRYEKNIPPGFKDDHKDDELKYGDLVVWKQLVDKAKESNKPLIFVTDDRKDDWWERTKGKVIRPRPELIQEMWSVAGAKFYMYQTDPFMEQAAKRFKRKVKQNAIDEIKEIRTYHDDLLTKRRKNLMVPFDMSKVDKRFLDFFRGNQKADLESLLEKSARNTWSDMMSEWYLNNQMEREEEMKRMFKMGRKGGLLSLYDNDVDEPRNEIDDE